jgi:hypothetical protein
MTTVYSDVVADVEGTLQQAGFSIQIIGDYSSVICMSNFSFHFSIDKHNPSSLSVYILTPNSHRYELGILEEVIDQKKVESDRRDLSEAFVSLKLNPSDLYAKEMQGNLHIYLKMSLMKVIDFLVAYRNVILDLNEPYRDAYMQKSKERMSRIGL